MALNLSKLRRFKNLLVLYPKVKNPCQLQRNCIFVRWGIIVLSRPVDLGLYRSRVHIVSVSSPWLCSADGKNYIVHPADKSLKLVALGANAIIKLFSQTNHNLCRRSVQCVQICSIFFSTFGLFSVVRVWVSNFSLLLRTVSCIESWKWSKVAKQNKVSFLVTQDFRTL